jgi:hypothetical protein
VKNTLEILRHAIVTFGAIGFPRAQARVRLSGDRTSFEIGSKNP